MFLQPSELEKSNLERFQRYEIVKQKEQMAEEYLTEDADIVVVAFGATSRIANPHPALGAGNKSWINPAKYTMAIPGPSIKTVSCKKIFNS